MAWFKYASRFDDPRRFLARNLHCDFERALAETKLPERPDSEAADRFLIKARREMADSSRGP